MGCYYPFFFAVWLGLSVATVSASDLYVVVEHIEHKRVFTLPCLQHLVER